VLLIERSQVIIHSPLCLRRLGCGFPSNDVRLAADGPCECMYKVLASIPDVGPQTFLVRGTVTPYISLWFLELELEASINNTPTVLSMATWVWSQVQSSPTDVRLVADGSCKCIY